MGIKAIARLAPVHVAYTISAGEAADCQIFVADQDYEIMDVRETHSIAGASSTTLDVGVSASGTAAASLTTALSSTFSIDSTADTPVQATLTSTLANRRVDKGEQISLNFTGTVTAYEGAVHIVLKPVRTNYTY
jgi:hypothetical protein|tara:strand:+ start:138 stop:539 length:402 start_codon:yes stop_codon:yes gene_type:complete